MSDQADIIAQIRAKMAAIESGQAPKAATASNGKAARAITPDAAQSAAAFPRAGSVSATSRTRTAAKSRTMEKDATRDPQGGPESRMTRKAGKEKAFDHGAAMRKIERLCSMREQASAKLRERLVRDGFPADVADGAVDRAMECGLVDDMRYADVLVRCRAAAGKGRAGIARELAAIGIDASNVEAFNEMELLGDDAEVDRAVALLERKPPRAKNARDAAYRRLVGKGFSSSVAASAARLWWESAREGGR